MADVKKVLYEGMFLLHQGAIATDFAGTVDHVTGIIERHDGEILLCKKWEERKLAYPIQGQRRGTFLVIYFNAPGASITKIERDCHLSEKVLRIMIIRGDHIGEAELEAARKDGDIAAEAALRGDGDERDGESTPKAPENDAPAEVAAGADGDDDTQPTSE